MDFKKHCTQCLIWCCVCNYGVLYIKCTVPCTVLWCVSLINGSVQCLLAGAQDHTVSYQVSLSDTAHLGSQSAVRCCSCLAWVHWVLIWVLQIDYRRQSLICFRPGTLSPALRRKHTGRHDGDYTAWTLPGSTWSHYAMRRGNIGTSRVIDAGHSGRPSRLNVASASSYLCLQTAGLTRRRPVFQLPWLWTSYIHDWTLAEPSPAQRRTNFPAATLQAVEASWTFNVHHLIICCLS